MANLLNILPEANKPVSSAVSIVCLSKTNRVVNPVQVPRLICFSMKFILPRWSQPWLVGGFNSREEYGSFPIGSMYAIYGNIYHQYTPNVSIYTIHGSCGFWTIITQILLMEEIWKPVNNASFLLLELPPSPPKKGLVWHFRFFWVGHNWILNCGNGETIAKQDGETMG